jgi:hypothetical protein
MGDLINFDIFLDKTFIEILILLVSVSIVLLIQLLSNKQIEKSIERIISDLSQIQKQSEVHSNYLSQFNDHFSIINTRLKKLEEITAITSRDISSMAEGITGEVGVGKAIELARSGADVNEIIENSNLNKDQAELIIKFHGN